MLERGPSLASRVIGSSVLRRRQLVARGLCRLLGRVQVTGLDLVPDTGPVILAVNHTSLMDGPLLFGLVDRPVSFLVKAEAFEPAAGLAGRILRAAGQLPVRRYQIDPAPIRYCLALLRAGGVLGMFPEGSRGSGLVEQVRSGVGYFAIKTGAPVLPVAVIGSARMVRTPRRPPVRIRIGQPIRFASAPGNPVSGLTGSPAGDSVGSPVNRQHWQAAAETVRLALAELVAEARADLMAEAQADLMTGADLPPTTMKA